MRLLQSVSVWAWETSLAASVLIFLALLAAAFLRKPMFTPLRHLLGLLIIARLLLPFALSSPLSIFNFFPTKRPALAPISNVPTAPPVAALKIPTPQAAPISTAPLASRIEPLPILWAAGVLAIMARIVHQHRRARRWMTPANRITSGPAAEALSAAQGLTQCHRTLRLYSVPELSTPALFGIFRPAILLPEPLLESAAPATLRLIFLHEIAHLRRLDVLVNWLMILAQALHWFNPFVWFALRRHRAEQELLCDAAVMRLLNPGEHRAYGETLLALASPSSPSLSPLIPISTTFKQMKERIAMITQFKPATHRLLVFALPPLAALLAILTFTGAADKRPAKPPTEPAKAAAAADDDQRRLNALNALERQLDEQTARVQNTEADLDKLGRRLGISWGSEMDLHHAASAKIQKIEADRIGAEREYVQFNQLLSSLKSKKREELIQTIPTAYRDEALDRLLTKLEGAEQQRATLQIDKTDTHPELQANSALIKQINKQIDARLEGIIKGLETLVAARKAVVDSLNKQIAEATAKDADLLESSRPYLKAKRDLEVQQQLRDSIYVRLLQEKIDSQLR